MRIVNSPMPGMKEGTYQISTKAEYRVYIERIERTLMVRDVEPGVQEVESVERDFGETRETVFVLPCEERHVAAIVSLVMAPAAEPKPAKAKR